MVGFMNDSPTVTEEREQKNQFKNLKESVEPFDSKFSDFPFDDSSIDFDSIRVFLECSPNLDEVSLDFERFDKGIIDMGDKDCSFGISPILDCSELVSDGSRLTGEGQPGSSVVVKEEKLELEKEGDLGSFLEAEMSRVSLVGGLSSDCGDGVVVKRELVGDEVEIVREGLVAERSCARPDTAGSNKAGDEIGFGNVELATESGSADGVVSGDVSGVNNEVMGDESDSGSDSESSSSSSYASPSSSSDDDDEGEEREEEEEESRKGEVKMQLKKEVEEGEIEEGEIVGKTLEEEEDDEDNMVKWGDAEFDDIDEDEDCSDVVKGPIRSQNELKVLPPVPRVDVTLQPHHRMLPVGVVMSTISTQVIVEGVEKHNPLNEGSILWITDKREPLGLVDEIFGPVQNPYYVIRYNSECEIPSGISRGISISFVPEFASHVLNEKNLYKRGYDASGENDEELSDEAEFSDDEKEAEYLRMKKISKRSINGQTVGNKKNCKVKEKGNRKNIGRPGQHPSRCRDQLLPTQGQHSASSTNNYPSLNFSGFSRAFSPNVGIFQPHGGWANGLPSQQPRRAVIPSGFPGWPAQNQIQHPYQMPIRNGMPFLQQFNPSQGPLANSTTSGGQMNLYAGLSPWPAVIGQSCFNQAPFGMGFQFQSTQPTVDASANGVDRGTVSNAQGIGMEMGVSCDVQQLALIPGNVQAPPQQFHSGPARRYSNRGGGRFRGGRGRKALN